MQMKHEVKEIPTVRPVRFDLFTDGVQTLSSVNYDAVIKHLAANATPADVIEEVAPGFPPVATTHAEYVSAKAFVDQRDARIAAGDIAAE